MPKGDRLIYSGLDLGPTMNDSRLCTTGTIWYAPPEYLEKKRGIKGDMYGLGIVMLYVWQYISLPEEQRPVHSRGTVLDLDLREFSIEMTEWVRAIEGLRLELVVGTPQERILTRLLPAIPDERISSQGLLQLAADEFPEQAKEFLWILVE